MSKPATSHQSAYRAFAVHLVAGRCFVAAAVVLSLAACTPTSPSSAHLTTTPTSPSIAADVVNAVVIGPTGVPLAGASVSVSGVATSPSITDMNGEANLGVLTPGQHDVAAALDGYLSKSVKFTVDAVTTRAPTLALPFAPPTGTFRRLANDQSALQLQITGTDPFAASLTSFTYSCYQKAWMALPSTTPAVVTYSELSSTIVSNGAANIAEVVAPRSLNDSWTAGSADSAPAASC